MGAPVRSIGYSLSQVSGLSLAAQCTADAVAHPCRWRALRDVSDACTCERRCLGDGSIRWIRAERRKARGPNTELRTAHALALQRLRLDLGTERERRGRSSFGRSRRSVGTLLA